MTKGKRQALIPADNFPEIGALLRDLPLLVTRLHGAGLHQTAHYMDATVRALGWEVSDLMQGKRESVKDRVERTGERRVG